MIEALRAAVDEVLLALAPLTQAAGDSEKMLWLLSELGWTPDSVPQPLADLATAGSDLIGLVGADPDATSTPEIFAAVGKLVAAIDEIRTKPDSAFPSGLDVASFKATIGPDLLDYLLVEHLLSYHYGIAGPLLLAGFIRLVPQPASGLRRQYLRRQVMWSAAGETFEDPVRGFRDAFDWNSSAPRLTAALGALGSLLEQAGMQFSYIRPADGLLAFVTAGATGPAYDYLGIDVVFDTEALDTASFAAGLRLLVLSATASRGQAVGLLPYATLTEAADVEVTDNLTLSVQGDADFTKGVALILAPAQPVDLQAGFLGGQATSPATIAVKLTYTPPTGEPERVLVGTADGSRLSIQGLTVSAGATLISAGKIDAFVQLDLKDALVAIKPDPGETDSFIGSLLGDQGISAQLSFGLRVSSLTGFHVTGSDGLRASLPAGVHLGPVDIQAVEIGLDTSGGDVSLAVGVAVAGTIGPLSILADQLGFTVTARFPSPPTGNLGPLDLDAQFAPPSGIGVSVDAQGVLSGGGTLYHDDANHLYAGVLQLSLHEHLTVTAFGLIATQLPGGDSGYSVLIFLTVEDFEPIPLGLGFTLQGIGGLVGVHRTFDETAMRAALPTGELRNVLFPADPVRHAADVVHSLQALFPARTGSYLLGLLLKIGWGSPTLLTMDLGVIYEWGSQHRLIILGRVSALLPQADDAVIALNMDALGVVDFDAGTMALDAVLYDSKVCGRFALTGATAMRAAWQGQAEFALAVGGLHPKFSPPPGFPGLDRLSLALTTGDNPKLLCQAYFGVTSNTVQFGANCSLYATALGFSLVGDVGFDVLVQLLPFHFLADYQASVQLKHGSSNLFKVTVEGELEGPLPLRLSGSASFEILWCDFSVSFDATLVDGGVPNDTALVDVLGLLTGALADPRAWQAQLPDQTGQLVTRRPDAAAAGQSILLHPLGTLTVRQTVVPLGLSRDIDRVGTGTPSGDRRFAITQVTLGPTAPPAAGVQELFAPAQFFDMSDDDKLAAPAFESMDAGVAFGDSGYTSGFDAGGISTFDYTDIIVGADGTPQLQPDPYHQDGAGVLVMTLMGAAARSGARRALMRRFAAPVSPAAPTITPERWAAVPAVAPATTPPAATTWAEARGQVLSARDPAAWVLAPTSELVT